MGEVTRGLIGLSLNLHDPCLRSRGQSGYTKATVYGSIKTVDMRQNPRVYQTKNVGSRRLFGKAAFPCQTHIHCPSRCASRQGEF